MEMIAKVLMNPALLSSCSVYYIVYSNLTGTIIAWTFLPTTTCWISMVLK